MNSRDGFHTGFGSSGRATDSGVGVARVDPRDSFRTDGFTGGRRPVLWITASSPIIEGLQGKLLTFAVLERFACLTLVLSAPADWVSISESTRVLRLLAEAVICFETFCFSASSPPIPRLGRVKERPWVGRGILGGTETVGKDEG